MKHGLKALGMVAAFAVLAVGCGPSPSALPNPKNAAKPLTGAVNRGAGYVVQHTVPQGLRTSVHGTLNKIKGTGAAIKGTGTTGSNHVKVIGFFAQSGAANGIPTSLKYLEAHPKAIDYLAPLWYSLQPDGTVKSHVDAAVLHWANSHKVPLMPLINNANGTAKPLTNNSVMHTAVVNVTNLVFRNNFAGISVDFQLLPASARTGLTAFMDTLSHNLRPKGKAVTVNIIPGQQSMGQHGAYDEVALSRYADQLILMTYDHHSDSSPPGPVSPAPWVKAAVVHTVQSGVQPSKIYLGVNTYGYDWNTTTQKATTLPLVKAKTAPASEKYYNPTYKETRVVYNNSSGHHVAWYGNEKSLADKLSIARKNHLFGIAIWRIGYEDANFWTTLEKLNGKHGAGAAGTTTGVTNGAKTVVDKTTKTTAHDSKDAVNAVKTRLLRPFGPGARTNTPMAPGIKHPAPRPVTPSTTTGNNTSHTT